jgi:ubiquitin-conjugating enzyme E2 J2
MNTKIKEPSLICNKRIKKEYTELIENPLPNIKIAHIPDNILDWYCIIYELNEEEYINGEYIFNIKMSANYPFEPPEFFFLTPNGRFDTGKKLCFSNSSYHKESWSPMWTIKTIILGFLSFFLEKKSSGIGHLTTSIDDKKILANNSSDYNQKKFKLILDLFKQSI